MGMGFRAIGVEKCEDQCVGGRGIPVLGVLRRFGLAICNLRDISGFGDHRKPTFLQRFKFGRALRRIGWSGGFRGWRVRKPSLARLYRPEARNPVLYSPRKLPNSEPSANNQQVWMDPGPPLPFLALIVYFKLRVSHPKYHATPSETNMLKRYFVKKKASCMKR